MTTTVSINTAAGPQEIAAQVGRTLRRYSRPAPAQPVRVQPLWEREQLFREPAWPEGTEPIEDDDGEGD
jgi:hypothetical protein